MPIHTESKCIVISQRLYLKSPNTEITMLSLRKAWNVSTLEPTHQFKGMTYMQHRWMPETSCRVSRLSVNTVHFPYRTWAATDCRDCHLRLEGCWATSPYLCFHAVLHHQNSQSYPCKGLTLLYGLYPPRRVAMRSTQWHLSQQGKDDQLF